MKVGAYVAGYSPDAGGGYTFEREILDALAALAPGARHRFAVLAPATAAEAIAAHLRPAGIAVRPVVEGVFGKWVAGLERESALFRAHWRRPSAIDRAASAANVDFVWFLGAGVRQTDLPYLTVVWDLQHRATPWFPEMSARGLWEGRELAQRGFFQRATAVVTGTRVGQEELARYYEVPAERTLLLPHPTPRFALEAASRAVDPPIRTRFGLEGQFLLYPAQFWPHKNHVNLVRALAVLRDRDGLPFMLALVGSDKGNRAVVEAEIKRLGLGDAVRFLGFVERSDLVALYRQAFALVYPSWCGPENLPPLEAFALGCPVVATRIPGAEEQLGEATLLVEPGDPASIADGVKALAADKGIREQLVARGRARAERWTAQDYVRGVLGFLDRFEPVLRCWRPDQ
jgi:glycosyltransferase involved in cell wall biosynthesis